MPKDLYQHARGGGARAGKNLREPAYGALVSFGYAVSSGGDCAKTNKKHVCSRR
jgi:hypothetical protein